MKDCRQCFHSIPSALGMGQRNCRVSAVPVLTTWARRPDGVCGVEARLFSQREEPPHPMRRRGDVS